MLFINCQWCVGEGERKAIPELAVSPRAVVATPLAKATVAAPEPVTITTPEAAAAELDGVLDEKRARARRGSVFPAGRVAATSR